MRRPQNPGVSAPLDNAPSEPSLETVDPAVMRAIRDAMFASDDPGTIVQNTVSSLAQACGYTHVSAYLRRGNGLLLLHQIGSETPAQWLGIEAGICGRVAQTGRAELVSDVRADPDYVTVRAGITSQICVPFGREARSVGVLNVEMSEPGRLTEQDLSLLRAVADVMVETLDHAAENRANRSRDEQVQVALNAAAVGTWSWIPSTGALDWQFDPGEMSVEGGEIELQTLDQLLAGAHAGDFAYLEHAFRRAAVDGDLDIEFRLGHDDVSVRWLNLRGQTVERAIDGGPNRLAGVVFDVTGRKRLERERLRLVHLETERANAEEAQRKMATTIERLQDGYVGIDGDRRLTLVNEEAARLFGASREALVGLPLEEALRNFGDEHAISNFLAACAADEPNAFDAYDPRSGRFVEVRIFSGAGGATVHLRDVTEVRQAEYERQRSEARFRSLVKHASDLILILNRRAVIQFASPAIERMLGYTPEEVVGRDDYMPIHPDDAKRFRQALIRILRTPGTHPPFEIRVQHRDGSYRWLEIITTNLLTDPLMHGVVANCRDITERHASEFNLWLLSEVSTVMAASLDLDQSILALNRLLVMYLSDVSLVAVFSERGDVERFGASRRTPETIPLADARSLSDRVIDAIGIRSGRLLSSRHTLVIDVSQLDLAETAAPYTALGACISELGLSSAIVVPIVLRGQVRGVLMTGFAESVEGSPALISMIEDVARRAGLAIENAVLYQHAREAIDARDRFLSVAAHELRTPITSVTGYTSMLKRELRDHQDSPRITRYLGRLDEASDRLSALAEDLLDVSRVRSGMLPLRTGPVDMAELTRQIVLRYAEQRSSARERITVHSGGHGPPVLADPERLEQVVTNIIDNALKYSPPDTLIEVSVDHGETEATLIVRDHGIGVATDKLESIFEPFGRAANAEETGASGLGLGLYICRTIVDRLGGSIWAESDGENTGLTVFVQLPLVSEEPERAIVG